MSPGRTITRAIVAGLGAVTLAAAPQHAEHTQSLQRTTRIDNATVAVTRLAFPPGMREEKHTHPFPLVLVQITPGSPTLVDREMRRVGGGGTGEVWFLPADTPHAVANNSTAPFEMLAIAIKPDRPPAPAAPPTEAPPGITRATLVDNADVRVVRVRFAPDGREPLHSHPNDLLTVQITPGKVTMLNGGKTSTVECEPGYVQFLPRGVEHSYASADSKPFELLSMSIK